MTMRYSSKLQQCLGGYGRTSDKPAKNVGHCWNYLLSRCVIFVPSR